LNVNDSTYLITSNKGLSLIDLKTGKCTQYFEQDGLHNNNLEELSAASYKQSLLVGGVGGFSIFNSNNLQSVSTSLEIFFTHFKLTSEHGDSNFTEIGLKKLTIPNNIIQTKISFSSPTFLSNEKITYSYRIEQLNKKWIYIGNQNFIDLVGLSPGNYNLYISASLNGTTSNIPSLQLIILPKWYQTFWFKLLLITTGICIGYGMYHYRLLQLKREETIRTRIAADLHDDIGSTLTSVRIFTDLGLAKNSTDYLPQIRSGIQDASTSLRDIIWVLDKTNNNAKQLLERIAKFALPLTVARQIDFRLNEEDGLEYLELGMELRRDLYLISKEFITNTIKYSQCQNITLSAKIHNKKLALFLQDDGTGFDPTTINRGNGLNNMTKRAKNAGYIAIFNSPLGQGSSLELSPST
jgi:hypothetical protein